MANSRNSFRSRKHCNENKKKWGIFSPRCPRSSPNSISPQLFPRFKNLPFFIGFFTFACPGFEVMNDNNGDVDNEVKGWEICSELANSETDSEVWNDSDDKLNPFLPSSTINKVQFRKHVSKACWDDELCMAEVMERKGSVWTTTGLTRNGKLYLFLEEALFFAKRGALIVLKACGEPLSVTDLFQKLSEAKNRCTFKYFLAYQRLKLLGYVSGRHNVTWTMKSCDKSSSACSVELKESEGECSDALSLQLSNIQINEIKPAFDVYLPNSKFRKSSPGIPNFILCMLGDNPPSLSAIDAFERSINGIPLRYCYVGHGSRVILFSSKRVELPTLP